MTSTRDELNQGLSLLFQSYNAAKTSRRYDPKRLHKALGLAQRRSTTVLGHGRLDIPSADGTTFYLPNLRACSCEDYKRHMRQGPNKEFPKPWVCKHILTAQLIEKARRLSKD